MLSENNDNSLKNLIIWHVSFLVNDSPINLSMTSSFWHEDNNMNILWILLNNLVTNISQVAQLKLIFVYQGFNIFQVYLDFTIYRQYFLLKFEQFSWISYTTLNQEVPKTILGG
jgi:hypothetical protein